MSDVPASDLPSRLDALIARARSRASDTRQPVLVSVVEQVDAVDPLVVLSAMDHAARSDRAIGALLEEGRMFWALGSAMLSMAALGAAAIIRPSGADRFAQADRAWRTLLESALVDEADERSATTGPLLMGGASFEPTGPRTPLWDGFDSTHLFVPAVLVTHDHGRTSLTTSVLVRADGSTSLPRDDVLRLRALALGADGVLLAREQDAADAQSALRLSDLRSHAAWRGLVRDAVVAIHADELRKVVIARAVRATAPHALDVAALLGHLRATHRDSYVFACWRGSHAFVGASPERLVRVSGRDVDASSLAGSAPRGATMHDDVSHAAGLLASAKDRAEHAIVRSALGDALSRFCDDVQSDEAPSLMTLPHVHHLHTAVHARLREGHSLLELVGALHPTPAVGGTPRQAALAFIREHEQLDRGWYAAPVGWIGRDAGELAVGLRSALVAGADATLFAGCGIVAGSDPERELAESQVKLRPMLSALAATLDGDASTHATAGASGAAR